MKYIILPNSLSHSPAFSVEPAPVTTLWSMLHTLPDPRRPQGTRHSLPLLLMLAILALCSGYNTYEEIAEWAENYQEDIAEQVSFLAGHTPAASTFHRVFSRLDIEAFEEVLAEWIASVVPLEDGEGVALDGKTVGGSGFHLVAAFAHIARAVLFQQGTTTKGKELVIGPKVLEKISLKNRVVTGDAIFAQRNICELIINKGGGFVFTVKDNQRTLREDIKLFFNNPPWGAKIETNTTVDRQKGRVEKRKAEVTTELNEYIGWPGVTHTWKITRERGEKGKTTIEIAYGIARLLNEDKPALKLNKLVRGHWQIENRLFRQKDVIFSEDRSTIRKKNAPQIMSALRNLVTTIFHRGCVRSFPKAQRRFAAKPEELFSFLGLPAYVKAYA